MQKVNLKCLDSGECGTASHVRMLEKVNICIFLCFTLVYRRYIKALCCIFSLYTPILWYSASRISNQPLPTLEHLFLPGVQKGHSELVCTGVLARPYKPKDNSTGIRVRIKRFLLACLTFRKPQNRSGIASPTVTNSLFIMLSLKKEAL